jgi:hypothetical protein
MVHRRDAEGAKGESLKKNSANSVCLCGESCFFPLVAALLR